eukprot:7383838-Prymnesium_polylepis.1
MQLNDTVPPMVSHSEVVSISITSFDDMPVAQSAALAFDEDSVPNGVEVALNLSDAEVNQVLEAFISRLPTKGTLFAINASGHRLRIDQEHNIFAIDRTVTLRSPRRTRTTLFAHAHTTESQMRLTSQTVRQYLSAVNK